MLSPDALARLSALNRQALPDPAPAPSLRAARGLLGDRPPAPVGAAGSAPSASPAASSFSGHPSPGLQPESTGLAAAGSVQTRRPIQTVANAAGEHGLVEVPLNELWPRAEPFMQRHQQRVLQAVSEGVPLHPELGQWQRAFPDATMYLDLETCGFAGSMVFLAGVLHRQRPAAAEAAESPATESPATESPAAGWVLTQLLARNYAEERAMLQSLWQLAAGQQVLVTFNGKSFDWPVVHDRSTLHRLGRPLDHPCRPGSDSTNRPRAGSTQRGADAAADRPLGPADERPELVHCDLLHHARRRWRGQLPNCRLQTLERYLCGRRRQGDIPGHAIPAAYHEFVRSGDDWQLRTILHHNALDLVTLLEISLYLVPDPVGSQISPSPELPPPLKLKGVS